MADYELLKRLCEARGISGDEGDVREMILSEVRPYADSISVTPLGNLIVSVKGKQPAKTRLMINAHMDEVGFIVTQIPEDGTLGFSCVGGIDRRVIFGRRVLVAGKYPGVIGGKPVHLLDSDGRSKVPSPDDLVIDIGTSTRAETEALVSPGDSVTFDSGYEESHGKILARAIDDRAGCAMMIELIREGLEYDTVFCFAVQEEIGLKGSKTASFEIDPQAAIVLESTTAADFKGVPEEKRVCRVGKGPVVSFMDRSTIYDKGYYRLAFDTAKELGIPCQTKTTVAGGNDAGAIHVSRGGVRCAAVSLPCRYLHSAVSMISKEDYEHALMLVRALSRKIAGDEA